MSSKTHFKHFNQTVWAMLVGGFLAKFSDYMAWPFLIVLLNQKLAVSPVSVGVILGVSAGLSAFLGLYIGYLSDKFGRKGVMIVGAMLIASAYLWLINAVEFWQFLGAMVLMGLGGPALEISTKAVISDNLADAKVREFALHLRYFLINLAGGLGGVIALWLGIKNPQALFIATCVIYGVYALWIGKLVHSPKAVNATLYNLRQTIAVLKNDSQFLYLIFANFLLMVVYSQLSATLPQIISLSLPKQAATFIVMISAINGVTIIALQFYLLKKLQRFNINRRAQIGIGLILISQILFALVNHSLWAWSVVVFVLSVGETIVFPTINVNIDMLAKSDMKGSYFGAGGLSSFGHSLGPILGGFVIGQLNDKAYFILTTLICAVCLGLYQRLYHRQALV